MKILIDADGCPVVKQTIEIAKENKIEVIVFCDTSHIISSDYAHIVTVSKGADSVDFAFRFQGCIDYSMNDAEILLACEVESLEKILTELLEDKLQQTKSLYSFIEPDFNFELFPKHKIKDENPDVSYVKPGHELIDVSADWIVNLWHEGALTANSFSVAMDREDIT